MTAPGTRYTDDSSRTFLRVVGQKVVNEVAARAADGPWKLASRIHDAIQAAPADDGSERHLAALIVPNDARAAVAGDPANLRQLGELMQEVSEDPSCPRYVIDRLVTVGVRWEDSMILNCSGILEPETDTPSAPKPAPAAHAAPPAAAPEPELAAQTASTSKPEPEPDTAAAPTVEPTPEQTVQQTPTPTPGGEPDGGPVGRALPKDRAARAQNPTKVGPDVDPAAVWG